MVLCIRYVYETAPGRYLLTTLVQLKHC